MKLLEGTNGANSSQRGQGGPKAPLGRVGVGGSTASSGFSGKTGLRVRTLFLIGTIVSSNGRQAAIWDVARVLSESE